MQKLKLLIFIDDDYATNHFHKLIVTDAEVCEKLLIFDSPVEALKYFQEQEKSPNPELPDFIFLDINMPQLTGWEFLEEYVKLDLEKTPTIIMLTTSMSKTDKEISQKFTIIKDFMNKPLNAEYLEKLRKEKMDK